MEVLIRQATMDDAKAIGLIGVISWKSAYRGIVPDEYLDSLTVEKRERYIAASLANTSRRFIIAEADGEPVGMACFYPLCNGKANKELWELEAIYVLPQYWNKGIGRILINHVFQYIGEHNALVCILWVLNDNHRAKGFYEHIGLTNTGIEKIINIGGKNLIEVCYSICLC